MDAFYASVEERDRPGLVGRPVIVGGTPEGRGVVAAANYAARRFGVHSAMPTATALHLCPHAVLLPVRLDHYAEVARQIRNVFYRYTPLVEPLSLDEAFLDLSGCERLFGPAPEVARRIKDDLAREVQLVASVGVAPNKFVAKVASDLKKPDALVVVHPGEVQAFLDPLPVGRLWGVGKVAGRRFEEHGIYTIGDLRRRPLDRLRRQFGNAAEHLWRLAQGIDPRAVVPERDARSVSHETTFAVDVDDPQVLRAWLQSLTEQVGQRLRRCGLRGRTVQIKVRFADFRTLTRAHSLARPTDITQELWDAARGLLTQRLPERCPPIRLLGMGVSALEPRDAAQGELFHDAVQARHSRLDAVADRIQERFGADALRRGGPFDGAD
ncbi:MAG: DNA polymerase IV [Chromatiales bacterium 21-64-14]|nr:MAG: DNA polymerase IV [Chromatiales bacterium 21-64-14]